MKLSGERLIGHLLITLLLDENSLDPHREEIIELVPDVVGHGCLIRALTRQPEPSA